MAGTRYRPGSWFGVVRGGTVVVLAPDTAPALVHSIWSALEQGPEAHEVLHEVTDGFGVALSRIPPFGIIDAGSSLRIFLRGDLELAVTTGRGSETVHGRDVTTWTERRFEAPESYVLEVSPAEPTVGGPSTNGLSGRGLDGWLPLSDGVVMLGGLNVSLVAKTDSAETVVDFEPVDLELTIMPTQLPEPVQEPEPVPVAEPAPEDTAAQETAEQNPADQDTEEIKADDVETEEVTAEEPLVGLIPASELTSNYDHLWEKTVVRSIEDAAIRLDPEAEGEAEKGGGLPDGAAAGPVPAAKPEPAKPEPISDPEPAPVPWTPPSLLPDGGIGDGGVRDGGLPDGSGSGLIDSVPWALSRTAADRPTAQQPASVRPIVHASPARQAPSQQPHVGQGDDMDHDGQTVMKGSLGALVDAPGHESGQEPGQPPGQDLGQKRAAAPGNGPAVLARVCGQGHANPPTYAQCAACGLALRGDAVQVPRPSLGKVRLSTGELIELEQSLIIGRQPSVSRVQGGAMPLLVQVASPRGDISRSHVEVRLEGWHVMLCDLKATNGTVLVREGQPPRRLAQNEMAILLDGDIAELGDGISLRFEEIL